MNLQLVLIPTVILLGLLFKGSGDNKRMWYIITTSFILMLFVALRNTTTGITETSDVVNYAYYFENIRDYSWKEIWTLVILYLGESEDVGYLVLQKAVSMFTHDFRVFSFVVDMIFFIPFGLVLYRYSNSTRQLVFSWVFFIVMYYGHLLTGARQVYAVGLDWLAFMFFLDNKFRYAALCVFLASSIHLSSIIIIIPMLLGKYCSCRYLRLGHLVALCSMPVVMSSANMIIRFMGNAIGSAKYSAYGEEAVKGGANTFIIMIALLSIAIFIGIKRQHFENSHTLKCFYAMAPCFTFFAPLIHSNGSMIRISEYFHLFLVLLFPFAVDLYFNRHSKIVYFIVTGVLALWGIVSTGGTYYFFWEA